MRSTKYKSEIGDEQMVLEMTISIQMELWNTPYMTLVWFAIKNGNQDSLENNTEVVFKPTLLQRLVSILSCYIDGLRNSLSPMIS